MSEDSYYTFLYFIWIPGIAGVAVGYIASIYFHSLLAGIVSGIGVFLAVLILPALGAYYMLTRPSDIIDKTEAKSK
jgi:hypothetical protein